MIPSEPADGLIDRYMMMYAGEVSVTGFQKILEIKGMTRRVDQQLMIDLLQQKLVTSAPEQVPSGTVNTNAGKSNAGTATGLKMKDDFSKYFSFKK